MRNGEAAIYFSEDEYGYRDESTKYTAEIFDFELQPLKSFNFPILRPYIALFKGNIDKDSIILYLGAILQYGKSQGRIRILQSLEDVIDKSIAMMLQD